MDLRGQVRAASMQRLLAESWNLREICMQRHICEYSNLPRPLLGILEGCGSLFPCFGSILLYAEEASFRVSSVRARRSLLLRLLIAVGAGLRVESRGSPCAADHELHAVHWYVQFYGCVWLDCGTFRTCSASLAKKMAKTTKQ